MELDLQSLFELLCRAHWLSPATPPPPYLGSYRRSLLVSQDRRHLFVSPCFLVFGFFIDVVYSQRQRLLHDIHAGPGKAIRSTIRNRRLVGGQLVDMYGASVWPTIQYNERPGPSKQPLGGKDGTLC
jgi:hypothetical protein